MLSPWHISWSTKKSFTFVLWSPDSWITSPTSSSFWTAPLQLKFFLNALQIRLMSRSSAKPATVVIHLRPFRCWTRTWTFSSAVPPALSPASSKASEKQQESEWKEFRNEKKKEGKTQETPMQSRFHSDGWNHSSDVKHSSTNHPITSKSCAYRRCWIAY